MSAPRTPDRARRRRAGRDPQRDRGAVLGMVLVLMVVGSLIIVPLLDYGVAVMKSNTILSDKTQRVEAVKGGFRTTLSDTVSLYDTCNNDVSGPSTPVSLASTVVNGITVTNRCYFLDYASALDGDELRVGLATPQLGQTIPTELTSQRRYEPDPADTDPSLWVADSTPASVTDAVFLPNLPGHGLNPRSSIGSRMDPTLATDGSDTNPFDEVGQCVVYFPGTYQDEVTITGPARTFFTSGVYYFEDEVNIVGGANVVVGDGNIAGCTTSQEALFYAEPQPFGSHNVTGLGATWVLGDEARLIVDNTIDDEPISFSFNKRYVKADDYTNLSASDVSIMTVNGEAYDPADPPPTCSTSQQPGDLCDPGSIFVPQSYVGWTPDDPDTTDVDESDTEDRYLANPATSRDYEPSVYSTKRIEPDAPAAPTVDAWGPMATDGTRRAAVISWSAPDYDGGSPVTGYTVTASNSTELDPVECSTNGTTTCTIVDLPDAPLTFTVRATNAIGDSDESEPSVAVGAEGPAIDMPDAPDAPTITMTYSSEDDVNADPFTSGVAHVEFTPPADDGGATITEYTVTFVQGVTTETCVIDTTFAIVPAGETTPWTNPLECDFVGLDPMATFDVTVTATNDIGSTDSLPETWAGIDPLVVDAPPYGDVNATVEAGELTAYLLDTDNGFEAHTDHEAVPTAEGQPPLPVVEINLTSTTAADASVKIPSYVSLPQGRLLIDNPNGQDVEIYGGVLAAQFDVIDSRSSDGEAPDGNDSVPIGFKDAVVQRKLRIVSTADGATSRAVIQVNQNGAYAINSWEVG